MAPLTMSSHEHSSDADTPTHRAGGGDDGAKPAAEPTAEPARSAPDGGVVVASKSGPRQYELIEIIGRGGMGDVHLANDPRVGRSVALKVMREEEGGASELAARFHREARVQGRLEHPSVVPVYDVDQDAEGRSFFVMKRVAGVTLDAVVRKLRAGDREMAERYTQRRLLSAFQQICLAIDYAHSRGVIHRDIKLSNLMLGDFGEVYVLDWGVAKVQATEEPAFDPPSGDLDSSGTTRHDDVLGTLGYMAPEQILDSRSVDPRADVYALGVVLFALLTHQPLHGRGTPIQLADSTRRGADARPSVRAPDLEIAPELDAICVTATALDPAARYPSARALHDAVGRYLDGDRDTRLRAELASAHLAQARNELQFMRAAPGQSAEPRRRALREAGRALALHPESEEATELLASLMFSPPEELPPEVEHETRALSQLERLRTGVLGLWSVGGFAVMLGLVAWLGVKSWPALAAIYAPLAAASAVLLYVRRQNRGFDGPLAMVVGVLICAAIAASSRIIGALWLPPLFAVAYTAILTSTHGLGYWRLGGVALALLSVLVPWGLEVWHVLPPSYVIEPGIVRVSSYVVRIEDQRAMTALGLACVGTVLLVAIVMWTFSAGDMKNRRELQLLAWHFRQVAPNAELPASAPGSERAAQDATETLDDAPDPVTKRTRPPSSSG